MRAAWRPVGTHLAREAEGPEHEALFSAVSITTHDFGHHHCLSASTGAGQLYDSQDLKAGIVVLHIMHGKLWHNNHDITTVQQK